MARIYDCSVDTDLLTGTRLARAALQRGELVVLPTDTVYGLAADAFSAAAVQRLLEAKGRTRQAPPPVLIGDIAALDALAESVPESVRALTDAFWPGGLTIVLHAQPSLVWDLGETEGTVALRMPANNITLELLKDTGPLAVSSANLTGQPAAMTALEASEALQDRVEVYLDGGPAGTDYTAADGPNGGSSTIIDATAVGFAGGTYRILRQGVISEDRIREVVGETLFPLPGAEPAPAAETSADETAAAETTAAEATADAEPAATPVVAPRFGRPAGPLAPRVTDEPAPTAEDASPADAEASAPAEKPAAEKPAPTSKPAWADSAPSE